MENKDDYALLRVIASSTETIKDDIREIKDSLKSKVEYESFAVLKLEVEELKKRSWFIAGIASAISFMANYFVK